MNIEFQHVANKPADFLQVKDIPGIKERVENVVYYTDFDKETERPQYSITFRDTISDIVMELHIGKEDQDRWTNEGSFSIDLSSEYGTSLTEGSDMAQIVTKLVTLVKAARKNHDIVKLISAETTYNNLKVSEIGKMKELLANHECNAEDLLPENIENTYARIFEVPFKPIERRLSDSYRLARIRLFEGVMKKYLPLWTVSLKYKKWISFNVPENI